MTVSDEARRQLLFRAHLVPASERPTSTAQGVHHLALICSDIEQTVRFYQDLLGFPLVEVIDNLEHPGSTRFFFDVGHDNLLAFVDLPGRGLGGAEEAHGGVQHIAVSVGQDAFDTLKSRLAAAGVEYLGPDRGLSRSMYLKDPDGIRIELLAEPLRVLDDRYLG